MNNETKKSEAWCLYQNLACRLGVILVSYRLQRSRMISVRSRGGVMRPLDTEDKEKERNSVYGSLHASIIKTRRQHWGTIAFSIVFCRCSLPLSLTELISLH